MRTLEDKHIDPDALTPMRDMARPGDRWAVYEGQALDSGTLGELRFLVIGPTRTFQEPPPHYPDTKYGLGWKFVFIGWVELDTGTVVAE